MATTAFFFFFYSVYFCLLVFSPMTIIKCQNELITLWNYLIQEVCVWSRCVVCWSSSYKLPLLPSNAWHAGNTKDTWKLWVSAPAMVFLLRAVEQNFKDTHLFLIEFTFTSNSWAQRGFEFCFVFPSKMEELPVIKEWSHHTFTSLYTYCCPAHIWTALSHFVLWHQLEFLW